MPLTVTFSVHEQVLIATLTGSFDGPSDEAADREIARQCKQRGLRAVLMDFRAADLAPTVLESYQSGANLGERGFDRLTRIAVLDRPEFKKANDLYGMVARNRGYRLRHFYTQVDAFEWLRGD